MLLERSIIDTTSPAAVLAESRKAVFEHAEVTWTHDVEELQAHFDSLKTLTKAASPKPYSQLYNLGKMILSVKQSAWIEGDAYVGIAYPRLGLQLLSNAWVDMWNIPRRLNPDHAADRRQRLADAINKHLLPLSGIDQPNQALVKASLADSGACACPGAEGYFLTAKDQITQPVTDIHALVSVYHDRDGQPIVFRKSHDESTGLTLQPMTIDSSLVPAGSIVGFDKERLKDSVVLSGRSERPFDDLSTYAICHPLPILPLRVSPWAYTNPLDRGLFGMHGSPSSPAYDQGRGMTLMESRLTDFSQAAEELMRLCGVTPVTGGDLGY